MKTFLSLLCFVLLGTQLAISQSNYAKVTYEVGFIKNDKDDSKLSEDFRKHIDNATAVKAFLLFNNKESLYFVEKKLKNDANIQINFSHIFAGSKNLYYSDLDRDYKILQTKSSGSTLKVSKELNEWDLWYTPSIPVSFGPKGYDNLPGLILEVIWKDQYFIVRKIEFDHSEAKKIKEPKKGKLITQEEYKKSNKGILGGK